MGDTIYIGKSEKWNLTYQSKDKDDVVRMFIGCDDLVMEETSESKVLFESLPDEFKSVLSGMAYDRGHAFGEDEVSLILRELILDLKPAIEKYTTRLLKN